MIDRQADEQLVERVQGGDIAAYEILVRRYERPLRSFVNRWVWDMTVAEEVVQDTLLVVYKTIDRVDLRKKFSTWVFEIAKNKAISRLRQIKPTRSIEETDGLQEDESMYERLTIQDILTKLPKKYLEVITCYYFDNLKYDEIAKKMHMPINTVRTNLRRAKLVLRRLYDQ